MELTCTLRQETKATFWRDVWWMKGGCQRKAQLCNLRMHFPGMHDGISLIMKISSRLPITCKKISFDVHWPETSSAKQFLFAFQLRRWNVKCKHCGGFSAKCDSYIVYIQGKYYEVEHGISCVYQCTVCCVAVVIYSVQWEVKPLYSILKWCELSLVTMFLHIKVIDNLSILWKRFCVILRLAKTVLEITSKL